MSVVVTLIGPEGTMRRRMVDTAAGLVRRRRLVGQAGRSGDLVMARAVYLGRWPLLTTGTCPMDHRQAAAQDDDA
jgi:hypothetical protein